MHKKKKLKTFLAFGMAAALAVTSVPAQVRAEETEVAEDSVDSVGASYTVRRTQIGTSDCYWALTSDGTLEITGSGDPGINARGINDIPWYRRSASIKSVSIDSTVKPTSMSLWFRDCTSLTAAPKIPSSVTDCSYMFQDCESLTAAPSIPSSVTDCGYMFYGCTSLTAAPKIPSSVTDCSSMFAKCTSLTKAPAIPSSVTDCGGMFWNCESLTAAPSIPSSVTDCSSMFDGCTSLTAAPSIPSSVTDCSSMFSRCTSLTAAPSIPSSVTSCGSMFYGCESLTTAPEIPSSVTSCGSMFKGCTSLTGNVYMQASQSSYFVEVFSGTLKPLKLHYAGNCTKSFATTIANIYDNVSVANYCTAISQSAISITPGSIEEITPTITGTDYKSISIKSADESVAKASYGNSKFTITGVSHGTTTATITAINYDGSKATKTFNVTVANVAPSITKDPTDVSTGLDTEVSFSIEADGTNNKYQWYMADNAIVDGTIVSGATSATYTIPADKMTTALNNKYFYCVVSNDGNDPVTSRRAKLSIIVSPTIPTFKADISSDSWANRAVSIEILGSTINESADNVAYKYSIDGGVTWLNYTDAFTWSTDTASTTIFAKAYNTQYPSATSDIVKLIVKYDATAPVISTVSAENRTVTVNATDATSGIAGYALTSTTDEPSEWNDENVITVEAYGTYYAWSKDNAGNTVMYDTAVTLSAPVGNCSVSMEGWKYGEEASDPVITSTTHDTENVSVVYINNETKEELAEKPSVPGSYTVKVTFPATGDYEETDESCLFTISNGTLNVKTQNYSGKYDGASHSAVVECADATVRYGTEDGRYDLSGMPSYQDAGTYTVYYEVSREYYDTVTGSVTVSIEPYDGTPENKPAATMNVGYTVKTVSDASLETYEGWEWEVPDVNLAVGVPYTAVAVYKGADAGNYSITKTNVVITRSACDHPEEKIEKHEALAATCTKAGHSAYTVCKQCGAYVTEKKEIPATGHTWDAGVIVKEATASEKGEKLYTCTICKETRTEAIDHNGVPLNKPESTMNVGYTVKTVGDVSLEAHEGWTWEIPDVNLAVGAPYTAVAVYKGADAGNYSITKVNVVITRSACDHPEGEIEKHEALAPTCTKAGHTSYAVCKQCGAYVTEKKEIPAAGHTWDAGVIVKEATATEAGEKTYTCSLCGMTRTETISPIVPSDVNINQDEDETATLTQVIKTETETITIWKETDNTTTVVYNSPADKTVTTVTIPEYVEVNGEMLPVKKVANSAFVDCQNLKEVTIGKNIEIIGRNAFKDCKNLTVVNLDSPALKTISSGAFQGCKALKAVVIPVNITTLGDNAFRNCKALTKVTMKSKVLESIGDNAFYGCEKLKDITIPATVKTLGDNVFKGCKAVSKVSMKSKVLSSIPDNAFNGCKSLKTITIPASAAEIGDSAFRNCIKLKTVTMKGKEKMVNIDDGAFYGCKVLKSITIPESVKRIGDSAFYNCRKLSSITIRSKKLTKKNTGDDAFKNVPKNTKVKVPKAKYKAYKKLLKTKGLSKSAKVTK